MAIQIKETFQVAAPIQQVWDFMMVPDNIVACMPGASLEEILSETSFVGGVKLKIGAITAKYNGTITYTEMDTTNFTVVLLAEAKEKGGGTITGTISCDLTALDENNTEVYCESNVDLTGKIVQVGRGMIDGVAKQIIGKFVANVKKRLEPAEGAAVAATTGDTTGSAAPQQQIPRDDEDDSINVLAVVWNVIWGGIVNFFKKLFGRG
jgi:carbon monoxide dehydrogenase subunit G